MPGVSEIRKDKNLKFFNNKRSPTEESKAKDEIPKAPQVVMTLPNFLKN